LLDRVCLWGTRHRTAKERRKDEMDELKPGDEGIMKVGGGTVRTELEASVYISSSVHKKKEMKG
jgi:hypothetical protein